MDIGHCMREMTFRSRRGQQDTGGVLDIAFLVLSETQTGTALLEDLEKAHVTIAGDAHAAGGVHVDPSAKKIVVPLRGQAPVALALDMACKGQVALALQPGNSLPLVDALDRARPKNADMTEGKAAALRKVLGPWPLRGTWSGLSPKDEMARELAVSASSGMTALAVGLELAEKGRMAGVKLLRNSPLAGQFARLMGSGAVKTHGVKAWRQGARDACLEGFAGCRGCVTHAFAAVRERWSFEGKLRREMLRDHALLDMQNGGFVHLEPRHLDAAGRLPGRVALFRGDEALALFGKVVDVACSHMSWLGSFLDDVKTGMDAEKPDLEKSLSSGVASRNMATAMTPHHAGKVADTLPAGQAQKGRES